MIVVRKMRNDGGVVQDCSQGDGEWLDLRFVWR